LNVPWPITRYSRRSIFWIPDCQDIEMPAFFSDTEIQQRFESRREAISASRAIFFSSFTARNVFADNFGEIRNIAGVIRFTISPNEEGDLTTASRPSSCADCLSDGFFYLPNQWWIHKNHEYALNEFLQYRKRGGKRHLILTGSEDDYRWPGYRQKISNLVSMDTGIHNRGFVDRAEQKALFVYSEALIQPSLYEGWSASIEEALSYGTPIISSNIPILREQLQGCADVEYFEALKPGDLVNLLFAPPSKLNLEQVLMRREFRWERFVSDFRNTLEKADNFIRNAGI